MPDLKALADIKLVDGLKLLEDAGLRPEEALARVANVRVRL